MFVLFWQINLLGLIEGKTDLSAVYFLVSPSAPHSATAPRLPIDCVRPAPKPLKHFFFGLFGIKPALDISCLLFSHTIRLDCVWVESHQSVVSNHIGRVRVEQVEVDCQFSAELGNLGFAALLHE